VAAEALVLAQAVVGVAVRDVAAPVAAVVAVRLPVVVKWLNLRPPNKPQGWKKAAPAPVAAAVVEAVVAADSAPAADRWWIRANTPSR
jgi:hypothetical protein